MKCRKLHTWIELKRDGIALVLGFGVAWQSPGPRPEPWPRVAHTGRALRGWRVWPLHPLRAADFAEAARRRSDKLKASVAQLAAKLRAAAAA